MTEHSNAEDHEEFESDVLIIAVAADTETWLPHILLGIPVDEDEVTTGLVPLSLTPDEAYRIGSYLIQAASTMASFYNELVDKSIEERKEIISLESQFLESSAPF